MARRSLSLYQWTKTAFKVMWSPTAGSGIMHQINLEKMSPVELF
jgi:aconitase A